MATDSRWQKIEYQKLKDEITTRIRLLHLFILVAVLFNLAFLLMMFALIVGGATVREIISLLLFVPVIFALLIFNYQANQMTLEGVAGYINHELKNEISKEESVVRWDEYYGNHKKKYQLTSFLKVMPLLLPMTLPIIIWIFYPDDISYPINLLMCFDLVLFGLVIFNFRYKFGK